MRENKLVKTVNSGKKIVSIYENSTGCFFIPEAPKLLFSNLKSLINFLTYA